MDTDLETPAAVVVGYDGSPGAELALDWAHDQARIEGRPLHILHATGLSVRPGRASSDVGRASDTDTRTQTRQQALVDQAARRVRSPGAVEVRTVLHHGGARAGLVGASRDAAVIVVGATGAGGLENVVLGSVANSVAKDAHCPVVVVRRSHAAGIQSVLVGTDGDPRSDAAVAFAFRVAASRACPLTVLRCFWDAARPVGDVASDEDRYDDDRRELSESLAQHVSRHPGVEVREVLSRGFADRRLIKATRDHDLVVIGHHKLPFLDNVVWGSVAPVVVREAVGDVAVVPARIGDDNDA